MTDFLNTWLNFRRKRFWMLVAVILYTVLGFFLVPMLVKNAVTGAAREDLGREARIDKVEFNPYLLSLRVQGFEFDDTDGVPLAGFEQLLIDFQVSSLFRWAWTFKEIRLDGPYFFFERFEPDDSRLSRLLADADAGDRGEAEDTGGDAIPRLLIHAITISNGSGDLTDNVPPTPVTTRLGPISIDIRELNTLPNRYGQQSVTIEMEEGATLTWQGSLALAPLDSEGDLVLSGSRLDRTIEYLKAIFPLEAMSATLSARLHYRVRVKEDGEADLEISDLELELDDLSMNGLAPATDFLQVDGISLQGGSLSYPEQDLRFERLVVDRPALVSWLDEDGQFSLLQLLPNGADDTDASPDEPASGVDWSIEIDEISLVKGALGLSDRSLTPESRLDVQDLDFKLANFSNQDGGIFPVTLSGGLVAGGTFAFEGDFGLLPDVSLSGKARARGLPLSVGAPYATQLVRIAILGGAVDTEMDLSMAKGGAFNIGGLLHVRSLDVRDTIENQPLMGWHDMEVDQFELDSASETLHVSLITFSQPFGRLVINADQTTNIAGLMVQSENGPPPAPEEADAFNVIVGGIRVDDGGMDFTDLSLPLPFRTKIASLNGTLSTISTASAEPSVIRLEGQVDEFGLARIEGSMNLLDPVVHTDVSLEFRNLLMSSLSPYSVQFAGQEIAEGKLDLDLGYVVKEGQLQGQNSIVLSDLVLGEKVEHPDAASLPLGLAVALLKDANGVIDVDLPVEGDVNDPEFRIGGVVWQAISGLIVKVVSAPFRLLGNLIGIESDDLGQFQFLAGRADLTPPELEKILQLEAALAQRPELAIELRGAVDPAVDGPALQFIRLRELVLSRIGEEDSPEDRENLMFDQEVRETLEALFTEQFPDIPLDSVKAAHMAPPVDDPKVKPALDNLAYAADIWDRLLSAVEIGGADLEALGSARAEAIRSAFLDGGAFEESRIVMAEVTEVESEDGEWVVVQLGVASE